MSFYPTSGIHYSANHQAWDFLAQKQIEFQNSLAERKVVRGKAWRKDQLRLAKGHRYRPRQGYSIPSVPGGHRWAHYCRPQELQVWRDHLYKDSLEIEGPLRCDDLGLWLEVFSTSPSQPIEVKTLASSDGQRLLAELTVSIKRASLNSIPDQSTVQASAWTGATSCGHIHATSAPRGSGSGQVRLNSETLKYGPSRGFINKNADEDKSPDMVTAGASVSSGESTAAEGVVFCREDEGGVALGERCTGA